jgi:protein-S-isoprenylcysteine O-methyltransferase Ste14
MDRIIIFILLSIPIIYISWRTLFNIKSHGFYRFFGWEGIIWLFASNYKYWFDDIFSIKQIISWITLLCALYLITFGVMLMKRVGKPQKSREGNTLFQFEKTTELIETGIYKYIRHPLYSSLIFLTWGIFFKNTTLELFIVSLISNVFLYLTAITEEKENITYFGEKYKDYMKRSKMFVPFII